MRGVGLNGEAEFLAEGFQAVYAGFCLVAEAEVFALVDLADAAAFAEDLLGELAGGEVGELRREGEEEGGVDAGVGEEVELLGGGGDEGVGGFRAEDADGVGVEGDGEGFQPEGMGAGEDLVDDPAVAAVNAVEVADGGDDGAEVGGDGGEGGEEVHERGVAGVRRTAIGLEWFELLGRG